MPLTLIRHIKTTAPDGMCYGQTDVELPLYFAKSHDEIVKRLNNETFDVVFSSPLQRCRLLAEAITKGLQPVIFDDRLKELNFGEWEQNMWSDIEKLPESKEFFKDYINVAPPGGESFQQMILRIKEFYDELTTHYLGKQVLIVSHGGPIRVFNAIILGLEIRKVFDFNVEFGEILRYRKNKMI